MRRLLALVTAVTLAACSPSDGEAETGTPESLETTTTTTLEVTSTTALPDFAVTSPSFNDGEPIPVEFTCDGTDINPALQVVGIPDGTQSLVIIVDDPDAPVGIWDHWVEFDIAAERGSFDIPEDTSPLGSQGVNSWNIEGYMGPCPPEGDDAHTYMFTIYAIDGFLDIPTGVDSAAVRSAMEGRVLGSVELTGTYAR